MAPSLSVTELHSIMSDVAPQALTESVFSFSKLLDIIPILPASDGQGPRWQTRQTRNSSPSTFTVGGALPAASASDFAPASLDWANWVATVSFSDRQFRQIDVGSRLGQMQVQGIIMDQLDDARIALAATMHTSAISGTGGNAFVGLTSTNGPTDDVGTYANILRSSFPNWATYVAHNSGTPRAVTTAILDAAYGYAQNVKGLNPGQWVMFCDYNQGAALRGLTTGEISHQANVTGVSAEKILGHTDIYYRGIPVIEIPGYTSARIDFLNLNDLAFETLMNPGSPFEVLAPEVSGDTTLFKIVSYMQLRLRDPGHGAFSVQDLS